ncbi:MAG: hypothetical protein JO221_08910 [Sphingomonas sp.]|nr:hypothetical protein [Sphingomonas sp.]
MATQMEPKELDLQEQMIRLRRAIAESDKFAAETRKAMEERRKIEAETKMFPLSLILQAMIATAALLGAGAALAKLLLPG